MPLLLGLVGSGQPVVQATITPQQSVRENGEPVTVSVSFKNISDRPIVMLAIHGRDGEGVELKKDQFLGAYSRTKSVGEFSHHYNLLAPGEQEALSVDTPGRPGKYSFDFQLDYLVVDDGMLAMPIFETVKKDPIKRNPPTYATAEEYEKYTRKQEVGKLGEVWRKRKEAESPRQALPYFLEVTPVMLTKTKTVRAAHVLKIESDRDIEQLHATYPDVRAYRSGIPHFGLAFIKDDALYVKQAGGYRKLGAVSFKAISYLGSLLVARRPIRISVGEAPCLRKAFVGRIVKDDRPLGQAVVMGQDLPVVDIQAAELERVWKCMERDHTSMNLSEYYDYLVVSSFPRSGDRPTSPPR